MPLVWPYKRQAPSAAPSTRTIISCLCRRHHCHGACVLCTCWNLLLGTHRTRCFFLHRRMWIPPPLRKFSTGSKADKNHLQSSAKKGSDKKYKVNTTFHLYAPIVAVYSFSDRIAFIDVLRVHVTYRAFFPPHLVARKRSYQIDTTWGRTERRGTGRRAGTAASHETNFRVNSSQLLGCRQWRSLAKSEYWQQFSF